MLTISKPTLFGADGFAARGQCNRDSPGWQLRWFDRNTPPVVIWQGAYKTCRHLQYSCRSAAGMDDVRKLVEEMLSANTFATFTSQPTDAYPSPPRSEKHGRDGEGGQKKKRRKKRH